MSETNNVADLNEVVFIDILDRALLQTMDLRETVSEINNHELVLLTEVILFGLGKAAAEYMRMNILNTEISDAA